MTRPIRNVTRISPNSVMATLLTPVREALKRAGERPASVVEVTPW